MIDFQTDKWKLVGMPGRGIYPVFPIEAPWYIDAYRGKQAILIVKRRQFAIAPAFACTAHSAQGKTLEKVIADLEIGRGVSSIASYVAITRIKRRSGLLIYRPFDRQPYAEGAEQGTILLLRSLRGEPLDWNAIGRTIEPKRKCGCCAVVKVKSEFTSQEFSLRKANPYCRECLATFHDEFGNWSHLYCGTCQTTRERSCFALVRRDQQQCFRRSTCLTCASSAESFGNSDQVEQGIGCGVCGNEYNGANQSKDIQHKVRQKVRSPLCNTCRAQGKTNKFPDIYMCARCKYTGTRSDFQSVKPSRDIDNSIFKCKPCRSGKRGGAQCRVTNCGQFVEEAQVIGLDAKARATFICETCTSQGETPGCCSRCHSIGTPNFFATRNFPRDKQRGSLLCTDCSSGHRKGLKCEQPTCLSFTPQELLTASQKKNRKVLRVCLDCQESGYNGKELQTFQCTETPCGFVGGRSKFQQNNFGRDKGKGALKCVDCAARPKQKR